MHWLLYGFDDLWYVFDKLWPLLLAIYLTQKIINVRKPKIEMRPEGRRINPILLINGVPQPEYPMWRIKVENERLPLLFAWLGGRETALRCKAFLSFSTAQGKELFSMQGRWANTLELPYMDERTHTEKIMYPDTVDVKYAADYEPLDCIVQFGKDRVAYAWNNESALTGGKNPRCKLEIGQYIVTVKISGQNFPDVVRQFNLVVSENSQTTSLSLAED